MNARDFAEVAAKEARGNWTRFDSFAWYEQPDCAEDWCIVYTSNRDSTLLDVSNAHAIATALAPFLAASSATDDPTAEDIREESHNHWAVGHVDGYAIRVVRDGELTPAFLAWCELAASLADYPLLDEQDYSEREYTATVENIEQVGRRMVRDDAPEDWASQAFTWFWEHDQGAVESRDDQGGYPSDQEMRDALEALGFLESEES